MLLLVFFSVFSVSAVSIDVNEQASQENLDAPFSITVDPDNITVMTGEDIVFTISIEAEEGFTSTVNLELEVSFVGYNMTINMFPLNPSFPRMQEATIEVPSQAQIGVAKGVLRATSGNHVVIKNVRISLVSDDISSDVDTHERMSWLDRLVIISDMIYGDLLSEFLKLNINDANLNPEIYEHLAKIHENAHREAQEREIEKKREQAREREEELRISQLWRLWGKILQLIIARLQLMFQYLGDSSTMMYHKVSSIDCEHPSRENFIYFLTKEDAVSAGYTACSICKP